MSRQGAIDRALGEWRRKHNIADNDPLATLAELLFQFRVHDTPVADAQPAKRSVPVWVAVLAVGLGILAGYLFKGALHG